ncbi:hypothetical protein JTE90_003642 [Oedothorax gibbosus]|uniref:Globin domain-containing protein n=1 Tax=Oedothorax gibbosus TaxID=931172 RepID=A0AAV6U6U4_9ARAC|nr:hypothetical protein JTE90_003642 [Oedothorax gibbosus]
MGCQQTKNTTCDNSSSVANCHGEKDIENDIEYRIPEVNDRQKELITETWKQLVDNISNVGVITFMNLFETHPSVQDVFMPFKGLSKEELSHSTELRAHGLRVMGFVQKIVARLHEPEKTEALLRELGRSHVMYGAKEEYVDLIGPQFVFAVKPSVADHWTDEVEESWLQLFRYMAAIMKMAMAECPDNGGQCRDGHTWH